MALTTTDFDELNARVQAVGERTVALLRSVDPATRLVDSTWTARQVSNHLVNSMRRYAHGEQAVRGPMAEHAADLSNLNQTELAAASSSDHAADTRELERILASHLAAAPPHPDERFAFHGGVDISRAAVAANMLSELQFHGYDVARAAGRPWSLDERDAQLVMLFAFQTAPAWVDTETARGLRLTAVIRVPGTTPQALRFLDGALTVTDADGGGGGADVVIRSPARVLMPYLYRRTNLANAVAHGMLVVGGRRPWTGLRLRSYFLAP